MEASSSSSSSYFLCETCKSYLKGEKNQQQPSSSSSQGISNNESSSKRDDDPSSSQSSQNVICDCCMGLWSTQTVGQQLKESISKACEQYGGFNNNKFATKKCNNHQPTISFAADVHIRYNYFLLLNNSHKTKTSSSSSVSCIPVHIFIHDLKQYLMKCVNEIIEVANQNESAAPAISLQTDDNNEKVIQNDDEEQGYLSLHILIIPPKDMQPTILASSNNPKKRRHRGRYRPFQTQGGDPRTNLELRLQQSKGYDWIPLSQVSKYSYDDDESSTTTTNIKIAHNTSMEIHVAVFRRPIFLYGYYTKSRRDVSQTPFVVPSNDNNDNNNKCRRTADDDDNNNDDDGINTKDDNNNDNDDDGGGDTDMKASTTTTETTTKSNNNNNNNNNTTTLGVTSVEEQICNPIIDLLGISTQNNDDTGSGSGGGGRRSNVIYGSCKFHASGREDMDVRMILRPSVTKGRPFCVQLIDALKPIQSQDQLINLIHTINHTNTNKTTTTAGNDGDDDDDDNKNNEDGLSSPMWYGCNPMGVGISDDLKLVPSQVFSNLQSDTETKIKHYGCYCWSSKELPMISDQNKSCSLNDYFFANTTFPLMIQQKTPIRVLHRRANLTRERTIYIANAIRIDNHHFRLELSTQAGTYIKEFVHGDLLRTKPSMATILNCKTNLLQLDCEGIDI